MKVHQTNFTVSSSGLVLNPKWPHLGASPNGIVNRSCCGRGVLEGNAPTPIDTTLFMTLLEIVLLVCWFLKMMPVLIWTTIMHTTIKYRHIFEGMMDPFFDILLES